MKQWQKLGGIVLVVVMLIGFLILNRSENIEKDHADFGLDFAETIKNR